MERKTIWINGIQYELRWEESNAELYCSIWKNNIMIANGSLNYYDGNQYEFSIYNRRKETYGHGIGTEIMRFLIEWALHNKIHKIFGFLSDVDKPHNWKHSLPFYQNLHNRIPQIIHTYFCPSLSQKNTREGAVDIETIKSSNSGYVFFILS